MPNIGSDALGAQGAAGKPTHVGVPVAVLGDIIASRNPSELGREVMITLAQAPLGSRVFLDSLPLSGPRERIRTLAVPATPGSKTRQFRARLTPQAQHADALYVPVAVFDGKEVHGEGFRLGDPRQATSPLPHTTPVTAFISSASPSGSRAPASTEPLPFPGMELIAHVDVELPTVTVFGPTPEGLRIAFYISNGSWTGPRINATYRVEGGDWIVVRVDGVAIPNARATLTTADGSLLYLELTGTIDLGPDGYSRTLAHDLPELAALSVVARIATSSERFKWLNRLTLVGAGAVNLKIGHAYYDLYSIRCAPEVLGA